MKSTLPHPSKPVAYTATSLEDIARHFDELAKVIKTPGSSYTAPFDKGMAHAYGFAAEILRQTTLIPTPKGSDYPARSDAPQRFVVQAYVLNVGWVDTRSDAPTFNEALRLLKAVDVVDSSERRTARYMLRVYDRQDERVVE